VGLEKSVGKFPSSFVAVPGFIELLRGIKLGKFQELGIISSLLREPMVECKGI